METKERELLELNVDDAWNIIIGKHDKYITVQTNYISRWIFGIVYDIIFKRKKDGKFFKISWTDNSDNSDTIDDLQPEIKTHRLSYAELLDNGKPVIAEEVFKTKKTITVYE